MASSATATRASRYPKMTGPQDLGSYTRSLHEYTTNVSVISLDCHREDTKLRRTQLGPSFSYGCKRERTQSVRPNYEPRSRAGRARSTRGTRAPNDERACPACCPSYPKDFLVQRLPYLIHPAALTHLVIHSLPHPPTSSVEAAPVFLFSEALGSHRISIACYHSVSIQKYIIVTKYLWQILRARSTKVSSLGTEGQDPLQSSPCSLERAGKLFYHTNFMSEKNTRSRRTGFLNTDKLENDSE